MKLYLDDLRTVPNSSWVLVRTVEECQELLIKGDVDTISMDNDLGLDYTEGRQLVLWMCENDIWPKNKPLVHSANVIASEYMRAMIDRYFTEKTQNEKEETHSKAV